jgi:hypothetical protein
MRTVSTGLLLLTGLVLKGQAAKPSKCCMRVCVCLVSGVRVCVCLVSGVRVCVCYATGPQGQLPQKNILGLDGPSGSSQKICSCAADFHKKCPTRRSQKPTPSTRILLKKKKKVARFARQNLPGARFARHFAQKTRWLRQFAQNMFWPPRLRRASTKNFVGSGPPVLPNKLKLF